MFNEKEYRKGYRKSHKEEHLKYAKEYYKINKERLVKNIVRRSKERRKIDIEFRLKDILRNKLWTCLKRIKTNKTETSRNLLGCTLIEFKNYIESNFLPEMTWDNHGQVWELDHIIGCVNFDLTKPEEQAKCFHYTNLEPKFKTTEIAESFGHHYYIGNRNKNKYEVI